MSEGSLMQKQDKLARCHHLPQSHCDLCCVENRTTVVLMMMAITACNQRQAILRGSTFYLEGEDLVVGSVKPSVLFSLHSFINLFCGLLLISFLSHLVMILGMFLLCLARWATGTPTDQSSPLIEGMTRTSATRPISVSVFLLSSLQLCVH